MKIKIITNTFGNYHRQNIAVDSWRLLRNEFPDNIELIDYQFISAPVTNYPDLTVRAVLSDSKPDIEGATKNLPYMNEIFENALKEDCDYFIITNSDVIIMPSLIRYILDRKPLAQASSRLDIEHIDSINSIINKQVRPVRYEIAGFDTFVFQKEWAEKNAALFETKYLMGKPLYDVVWAGYIKIYGGNEPLGNGFPPFCFHIHHGIGSVTESCPERDWNIGLTKANDRNILVCNAMVFNLLHNLTRRTPAGAFLNQTPEERVIEKAFFECMRIDRNLL